MIFVWLTALALARHGYCICILQGKADYTLCGFLVRGQPPALPFLDFICGRELRAGFSTRSD